MGGDTWAVGAGCGGVREEPACRFFWRSQTRCLQSGPSPSAERCFLRMFFGKGVTEACLVRCEATRGWARVSSEEARCTLLQGPCPCALGDPSRAGAAVAVAAGPAAGTRGPALPSTGPGPPESQLPAWPSGPQARGRLDGSPCRSAASPTPHPEAPD